MLASNNEKLKQLGGVLPTRREKERRTAPLFLPVDYPMGEKLKRVHRFSDARSMTSSTV